MKGQLSAEMLILIVVVMAVVGIAAIQLISSGQEASENIGDQTDHLNEMAKESIKSKAGQFCIDGDDCRSGSCSDNTCD